MFILVKHDSLPVPGIPNMALLNGDDARWQTKMSNQWALCQSVWRHARTFQFDSWTATNCSREYKMDKSFVRAAHTHTHTHTVQTNLTKLQLWRRLYRSLIWDVTAPSGAFFILPNISSQMHNIQLKSQHLLYGKWCGSDGCKNASLCTHCRLVVDIECMSHPLGLHICLCLLLVTDVALLVFGIIGKVTAKSANKWLKGWINVWKLNIAKGLTH